MFRGLKNRRKGLVTAILSLLIGSLVLIPTWQGIPTHAQARVESRISRLESELYGIRSQLSRLEARLSGGRPVPPQSASNVRSPGQGQLSSDPMFDRLATLVIELKERINAVEARLTKLEE